jgi:lipoprotein-anchoring transpeptidase ErfK/SrfK
MVPSAFRTSALAVVLLSALALAAFPALRSGVSGERADAQPAQPPAASPTPAMRLRATTTLAPEPRSKPKPLTHGTARIRPGRSVKLRSKPGGPVVASIGARTEFGSRRVLAVAQKRGRWLGVLATERPNGKIGWVDGRSEALDRGRTKVSLRADLSRRRVELRVGRKVVKRLKVAVGRPGSSTPTGRFSITDKLSGGRFGPYYGCCILALSGHQPNLPPGWKGGNRLAIHGTNAPGTIGAAASAGCLRGSDEDLRVLMRRVPVGAQIVIKR